MDMSQGKSSNLSKQLHIGQLREVIHNVRISNDTKVVLSDSLISLLRRTLFYVAVVPISNFPGSNVTRF